MASSGIRRLAPAQRFMYEYGCFIAFWGNFEMMMEGLIWHLRCTSPITNCREINGLPTAVKRQKLTTLLKNRSPEAVTALDRVFDVAERNDWIHGVVLNPRGDFAVLTRFRVHRSPFKVSNTRIDMNESFDEFHDAYRVFHQSVDSALGIDTVAICDAYLQAVQQPPAIGQGAEGAPT